MVSYNVKGRPAVLLLLLLLVVLLLVVLLLVVLLLPPGGSFAEPVKLAVVNVGYSGPQPKIAGFSFLCFSYWCGRSCGGF
jgi:hypothetical protein